MPKDNKAEQSLTDAQRDACLERIDQDGYVVLPVTLLQSMIGRANDYKVSEEE